MDRLERDTLFLSRVLRRQQRGIQELASRAVSEEKRGPRGTSLLLDIKPAKKPTALRFILFAAIKNCTLRRVSRCTSSMRSKGSRNCVPEAEVS